jgi:hypothetical protein
VEVEMGAFKKLAYKIQIGAKLTPGERALIKVPKQPQQLSIFDQPFLKWWDEKNTH